MAPRPPDRRPTDVLLGVPCSDGRKNWQNQNRDAAAGGGAERLRAAITIAETLPEFHEGAGVAYDS